jgi:hypothetical protein
MMSGQMGRRSISEAAPGDPGCNGGRWTVVMVSFTPAGIATLTDGNGNVLEEITSDAELLELVDSGYLERQPTSIYFECPLRPSPRGRMFAAAVAALEPAGCGPGNDRALALTRAAVASAPCFGPRA